MKSISSFPGAVSITFFAPAVRCFVAPSLVRNTPVASITTSTPRSAQGSFSGSLSENTSYFFPSTTISLSSAFTSCFKIP